MTNFSKIFTIPLRVQCVIKLFKLLMTLFEVSIANGELRIDLQIKFRVRVFDTGIPSGKVTNFSEDDKFFTESHNFNKATTD